MQSHIAFGADDAHMVAMTKPPHIASRMPSDKFQAYADRYREAARACASELGSTRDPIRRKQVEVKLQKSREQVAFNEAKAQEMRDRGE